MALPYRKLVRDAIVACLAAGLNEEITANAQAYGIQPFSIDFSPNSRNFAQCYVDPEIIEQAPLLDFPAGCVYTEDAEDTGSPRALGFAGAVIGCVDFYIRQRDGIEHDTESALDRIEDAVMTLFASYQWPIVGSISTVTYSRRAKSQRQHFIPLSDGWASRISIQAQFSVFIN